jgi:hypothetical protein
VCPVLQGEAALSLVNTRNVELAPEPRRATKLFPPNAMLEVRVNVPGPRSTYWFVPQFEIAALMALAVPE